MFLKPLTGYLGDDEKVLLLSFADECAPPEKWIIFQRCLQPEPDPEELTSDLPFVSLHCTPTNCCGGIRRARLAARRLTLELAQDFAEALGVDLEIVVDLSRIELGRRELERALGRLVLPTPLELVA